MEFYGNKSFKSVSILWDMEVSLDSSNLSDHSLDLSELGHLAECIPAFEFERLWHRRAYTGCGAAFWTHIELQGLL